VAYRAGVRRIDAEGLADLAQDRKRTLYRFDVRTPEEYAAGHLPGFRGAPGGQLVQETDVFAPVRGGRIVLADDLGPRADMTASWLAQLGWDVYVLDGGFDGELETGALAARPSRHADRRDPDSRATWRKALADDAVVVLDLASSPIHRKGHVPGAWFAIRARLAEAFERIPKASRSSSPRPTARWPAWRPPRSRKSPTIPFACLRAAPRPGRRRPRRRTRLGPRRLGSSGHLQASLRGHGQRRRGHAGLSRLGVRPGRPAGPRRHARLRRDLRPAMTLKLYFAPASSAFAPLIALEEIGVAYEAHRVDLAAGEQRRRNICGSIRAAGCRPWRSMASPSPRSGDPDLSGPRLSPQRAAAAGRPAETGPRLRGDELVRQHGARGLLADRPARALRR
jgi:rhodanese-related sulfurtransferase